MEIATYKMNELEQLCSDSKLLERTSIGTIRVGNFLFSIPDSIIYHNILETTPVMINGNKGKAFQVDWIKIRKDENEHFHSSPDFVSRNGEEVFVVLVNNTMMVFVYNYGKLKHTFELGYALSEKDLQNIF